MTPHPRMHFTAHGNPKVVYLTREEAEEHRDTHCPAKDVYRCDFGAIGEHWHIGSRRRSEART